MTIKYLLLAATAAITIAACSGEKEAKIGEAPTDFEQMEAAGTLSAPASFDGAQLGAVLDAQSDKHKARYKYRNPAQTLEFFGITPGMTVVEALPGGGWYSKILIPYLGDDGHLIGVDYALAMWPEFGGFATPEFIEKKKTWPADWVKDAAEWRAGSTGEISAFAFEDRDTSLDGTVDAVLFVRALHNLNRFEDEGGYLTKALADTHALLKPGGIVGVVQHQGPEGNSDEWADGNQGYLKKSNLVKTMAAAGFELVAESDINANPKDVPSEDDIVWRLPPSLGTSRDNPELREQMQAIGESNRMTLLFRKK